MQQLTNASPASASSARDGVPTTTTQLVDLEAAKRDEQSQVEIAGRQLRKRGLGSPW